MTKIRIIALLYFTLISTYAGAPNAELRKAEQVVKAWSSKVRSLKSVQTTVTPYLNLVVDTQIFLRRNNLSPEFRANLEGVQQVALQKIIANPNVVSYLLKDFAQTIVDQNQPSIRLDETSLRIQRQRNDLHLEAIEAAIKSIGLSALPIVVEFQSVVAKYEAKLLLNRAQSLTRQLVKQGEKAAAQIEQGERLKEEDAAGAKELFPHLTAEREAKAKQQAADSDAKSLLRRAR